MVAAGLVVVVLLFSHNLFGRLNAAQDVIGGLKPAFNAERVAGDRAAINEISSVVNTPKTTAGWSNVPGTALCRFDGTRIESVAQIRDDAKGG